MADDLAQSGWLLPILSTMTKAQMVAIAKTIPREYHDEGVHWATAMNWRKDSLQSWIEGCRRLYWDSIPRDDRGRTINPATRTAKRQTTGRSVAGDLCQIPATECNAWLRSLPRPAQE